jgi:signal transduction histidine kinase
MLRAANRSVRQKLFLVVLATTFAALVVTGIAMAIYEVRTYQQSWSNDLLTQAEILGRASAPALAFDDPESATQYLSLLRARPTISAAAIYNARGKLFAKYVHSDAASSIFPALPELDGTHIEGNELVVFKRLVENNEILGTVYLRADYELWQRLLDYLGILGAVMALSLLAALLMSIWLQRAVTRPILMVAGVARNVMEKRDFSLRVTKTTEDEIGVLVDAFNAMLAEVGRRAEALESSNRQLEHEMAERRRTDDALRQLNADLEQRVADRTEALAAANKELEGFSYSVSHDLRAPLRAVIGFSKMLLEDHGEQLDAEARRKVDVIKEDAEHMGRLIDDLLAFSRLGRKTIQLTEVNMTELAQSVYDNLSRQTPDQHAEFRLGKLPAASGDRALLGQVWTNLISNAMKFSSKRDGALIEVSAVSNEQEYIYFVRDNGAGFDPRYQAKLFGVFQRLHDASEFPGTGVGLALIQRIVVRHRGRVWAEGKPGEGATFYFTLPREQNNGEL